VGIVYCAVGGISLTLSVPMYCSANMICICMYVCYTSIYVCMPKVESPNLVHTMSLETLGMD